MSLILLWRTPTGISSLGSADKNTLKGPGEGLLDNSSSIFSKSCNHLRVRWMSTSIKGDRNDVQKGVELSGYSATLPIHPLHVLP